MNRDSHECDSSTDLRYVACISYPRSGHHLTVRVLQQYFKQRFKYCQFYNSKNIDCCRTFPCVDASVNMTKNHDMDLNRPEDEGLTKIEDVPYLILVRNFLEAVVSDYNLFLRKNDDTRKAWLGFSTRKAAFYKRFLQKWVLADDGLEKLIVHYEQLTTSPIVEFARMIEFFHPAEATDTERLERIVSTAVLEDVKPGGGIEVVRNFGVRNRRKLEDFKYYDPVYFAELETRLADEFNSLGYPQRFAA